MVWFDLAVQFNLVLSSTNYRAEFWFSLVWFGLIRIFNFDLVWGLPGLPGSPRPPLPPTLQQSKKSGFGYRVAAQLKINYICMLCLSSLFVIDIFMNCQLESENSLLSESFNFPNFLPGGLSEQKVNEFLDKDSDAKFNNLNLAKRETKDNTVLGHRQFGKARPGTSRLGDIARQLNHLTAEVFQNEFKFWTTNNDVFDLTATATKDLALGYTNSKAQSKVSSANSRRIRDKCSEIYQTHKSGRCPIETLKIRTVDGSCNNQFRPVLGKSGTPLQRLIGPDYSARLVMPKNSRGKSVFPLWYIYIVT